MVQSASAASGRVMNGFVVRDATPEDAAAVAVLYAGAAHDGAGGVLADAPLTATGFETAIQTGSGFVVAERDGSVAGAVRWRAEEGIGWFDLLLSAIPGAGRTLVRAMEMRAQDHGLRLIRTRAPEQRRLPDMFLRWGYLPVGRVTGDREPMLTLEKRLPLLTVREQRRADAAAIGSLTGDDPWVFEQGARPGWFVASDGERVIGVIAVRDAGAGVATIDVPTLDPAYRGRGIEVWMVERAATYAETNGYHTAQLALTDDTDVHRRALEDRFWQREPPLYVRRFRSPLPPEDD